MLEQTAAASFLLSPRRFRLALPGEVVSTPDAFATIFYHGVRGVTWRSAERVSLDELIASSSYRHVYDIGGDGAVISVYQREDPLTLAGMWRLPQGTFGLSVDEESASPGALEELIALVRVEPNGAVPHVTLTAPVQRADQNDPFNRDHVTYRPPRGSSVAWPTVRVRDGYDAWVGRAGSDEGPQAAEGWAVDKTGLRIECAGPRGNATALRELAEEIAASVTADD